MNKKKIIFAFFSLALSFFCAEMIVNGQEEWEIEVQEYYDSIISSDDEYDYDSDQVVIDSDEQGTGDDVLDTDQGAGSESLDTGQSSWESEYIVSLSLPDAEDAARVTRAADALVEAEEAEAEAYREEARANQALAEARRGEDITSTVTIEEAEAAARAAYEVREDATRALTEADERVAEAEADLQAQELLQPVGFIVPLVTTFGGIILDALGLNPLADLGRTVGIPSPLDIGRSVLSDSPQLSVPPVPPVGSSITWTGPRIEVQAPTDFSLELSVPSSPSSERVGRLREEQDNARRAVHDARTRMTEAEIHLRNTIVSNESTPEELADAHGRVADARNDLTQANETAFYATEVLLEVFQQSVGQFEPRPPPSESGTNLSPLEQYIQSFSTGLSPGSSFRSSPPPVDSTAPPEAPIPDAVVPVNLFQQILQVFTPSTSVTPESGPDTEESTITETSPPPLPPVAPANRYELYINGELSFSKDGTDRDRALAHCLQTAEVNPSVASIRCTWNGEEFYNRGAVVTPPVAPPPPTPEVGSLQSFVTGHNIATADRINLVFVGINFASIDEFKTATAEMLGWDGRPSRGGAGFGPFAIEPLRSNKGKFNVWYDPNIITITTVRGTKAENNPEIRDRTATIENSGLPYVVPIFLNKKSSDLNTFITDHARGLGITLSNNSFSSLTKDALIPKTVVVSLGFGSVIEQLVEPNLLAQELGHSIFGLADEQTQGLRARPGGAPIISAPNCVATMADAQALWGNMVSQIDPFFDEWKQTLRQSGQEDVLFFRGFLDNPVLNSGVRTGYYYGKCYGDPNGRNVIRPTNFSLMEVSDIAVFGPVNRRQVETVLGFFSGVSSTPPPAPPTGSIDGNNPVSSSNYPTISGGTTGVSSVGISIGNASGKIYGSGDIPVVNGRWTVTVTTFLGNGVYILDLLDATTRIALLRKTLTVNAVTPSTPPPQRPQSPYILYGPDPNTWPSPVERPDEWRQQFDPLFWDYRGSSPSPQRPQSPFILYGPDPNTWPSPVERPDTWRQQFDPLFWDYRGTETPPPAPVAPTGGGGGTPATGHYEIYINGASSFSKEGVDRDRALAHCVQTAEANPSASIRCVWNGAEIYNTGTTPPLSSVNPGSNFFANVLQIFRQLVR